MKKKCFWPKSGIKTKGPYSPAVIFNNLIFVSGQGPVDPKTGNLIKGEFLDEMKAALENVKMILEEAKSGLNKILKVNIYLSDINNFSIMNKCYSEYFGPDFPARTTVQAAKLPFDIQFEIEVIAYLEDN